MKIVIGAGRFAKYLQGGGHWSWILQYLLGLRDLGHDVFLMHLVWLEGNRDLDRKWSDAFFTRLAPYWPAAQTALLLIPKGGSQESKKYPSVHGAPAKVFWDFVDNCDLLWNVGGVVRSPFREMFRRKVFVDVDPGHSQLCVEALELLAHDAFLTVGLKMHAADCLVPDLGVHWHSFPPFVYLPNWERAEEVLPKAPFTSVTHWWGAGALEFGSRLVSLAKRDAYLPYIDIPSQVTHPFELAVHIDPDDGTGDWLLLHDHGWSIVDPWIVTETPAEYRRYIARSRAEFCCAKPIFRELRTGWFSDRSACYLASGKPVLVESTGFEDILPCGEGLFNFSSMDEAIAAVEATDRDYRRHSAAARGIAEEYLDTRIVLPRMLAASLAA